MGLRIYLVPFPTLDILLDIGSRIYQRLTVAQDSLVVISLPHLVCRALTRHELRFVTAALKERTMTPREPAGFRLADCSVQAGEQRG